MTSPLRSQVLLALLCASLLQATASKQADALPSPLELPATKTRLSLSASGDLQIYAQLGLLSQSDKAGVKFADMTLTLDLTSASTRAFRDAMDAVAKSQLPGSWPADGVTLPIAPGCGLLLTITTPPSVDPAGFFEATLEDAPDGTLALRVAATRTAANEALRAVIERWFLPHSSVRVSDGHAHIALPAWSSPSTSITIDTTPTNNQRHYSAHIAHETLYVGTPTTPGLYLWMPSDHWHAEGLPKNIDPNATSLHFSIAAPQASNQTTSTQAPSTEEIPLTFNSKARAFIADMSDITASVDSVRGGTYASITAALLFTVRVTTVQTGSTQQQLGTPLDISLRVPTAQVIHVGEFQLPPGLSAGAVTEDLSDVEPDALIRNPCTLSTWKNCRPEKFRFGLIATLRARVVWRAGASPSTVIAANGGEVCATTEWYAVTPPEFVDDQTLTVRTNAQLYIVTCLRGARPKVSVAQFAGYELERNRCGQTTSAPGGTIISLWDRQPQWRLLVARAMPCVPTPREFLLSTYTTPPTRHRSS